MPLPAFNTANVNCYLGTINNNQAELDQLATDLETNFLGALQSRFTLSQWQIDRVNFVPQDAKDIVAQTARKIAQLHTKNPTEPVDLVVSGIGDRPPGSATNGNLTVDGEVSVEATSGSAPKYNGKVKASCTF
ncbi:MAG: hypothetical protein JNJ94_07945 [Chlorobi bacterium]|nr:hypothetical protein [Chlorobiota bacterium]